MTRDLVHGVDHSPHCQILLQVVVRAVIISSPAAWTSSAWMLSTQPTSLSSITVLQPPLLYEGWVGRPLCLSGDSLVLMDLHWPCDCTLFFYPVFFCLFHASLNVVVHFLVFLRSFRFKWCLSQLSPSVAQIKNFCSDPGFFFFWRCLPWVSLAVSVTALLKVVISESRSVYSFAHDGERCKLPASHSLEGFQHLGSFSFSRSNLSFVCFGLLILFRRRWKVIISKSWSLPVSAPGKLRVLAMFTPDRKRFLPLMWHIWLWCCPLGLCKVYLLDALWWPNVFADTRSLKVANSRSLSLLSFVSSLQKGPQMPCQFPQASLPTFAFRSKVCRFSVSDQWQSLAGHKIFLFRCHHSLTLGRTLVLFWCFKGLPSGGWW